MPCGARAARGGSTEGHRCVGHTQISERFVGRQGKGPDAGAGESLDSFFTNL